MEKLLFASLLTLAMALPVNSQVGPGKNPTDIADGGGQELYATVCTNSTNGRLSLRSGPGTNYAKIKEISNGHKLALIDSQYGKDGFRWWEVYHNNSRGWVRADYVCGDPN